MVAKWMKRGRGGWCQYRGLWRGRFAETPLSISNTWRRWGLVPKLPELGQIPLAAVFLPEGGAGRHSRGEADGAEQRGEVNTEGQWCHEPTWYAGEWGKGTPAGGGGGDPDY